MKKVGIVSVAAILMLGFSSCNKNNGCGGMAEKATVENYTGSDSCEVVFRLDEDGTKLEPTNLASFPSLNYEHGDLVWIRYKKVSGASTCQLGDIVRINAVCHRDY